MSFTQRRIWSVVFILFFASLVWLPVYGQESSDRRSNERIVVRDMDVEDGIYISSGSDPLRGRRISGLSDEEIRALQEDPSLFETTTIAMDVKTGKVLSEEEVEEREEGSVEYTEDRKIIYVTGVPLWGKEKQEVLSVLKDSLSEMALQSNPKIKTLGVPKGRWKLLQSFVYPAPLPQDIVPTSKWEKRHGIESFLISASVGFAVQFWFQYNEVGLAHAAAIVIPAMLVNSAQSAGMTFPRNTWGNYFRRGEKISNAWLGGFLGDSKIARRAQRVIGSIAQQIWLTAFFTFNVYTAGRGNLEAIGQVFSQKGLSTFYNSKLGSMLLNIFWRTPAENSWADYTAKKANEGKSSEATARAALIRKVTTIIATNLWVYSTLTKNSLWTWGGRDWNAGHLGMVAVGTLAIGAWIFPQVYDPVGKALEFALFPLGYAKRKVFSALGGCVSAVQSLGRAQSGS